MAQAFDMFLESVNHPVFLRTGLPTIDHALCGGIKHGGIVEVRQCFGAIAAQTHTDA